MSDQDRLVALVDELIATVSAEFVARDEEVRAIVLGLLSAHNVFMLSVPGTSKSKLVKQIVRRIADLNYFGITGSRHTPPDEMFGPRSLTELRQDRLIRQVKGFLPWAHVGLIDEMFKLSEATANGTLEITNERTYNQDGQKVQSNLHTLVAASNETPQDEHDGLGACWDRLMIRRVVDELVEDDDLLALWDVEFDENPPAILSWDDVLAAHAQVLDVDVPRAVFDKAVEIKRKVAADTGFRPSNRRWRECKRVIQAAAWLGGRTTAVVDDLWVLELIFWTDPDQVPVVQQIVAAASSPLLAAAYDIRDSVAGMIDQFEALLAQTDAEQEAASPSYMSDLKRAGNDILAKLEDPSTAGRPQAVLADALNRLMGLYERAAEQFMGADPVPFDMFLKLRRKGA